MALKAGETVVVRSPFSDFNSRIGRVVEVRPFDVLVSLPDNRAPLHRSIVLPFGRGELVTAR